MCVRERECVCVREREREREREGEREREREGGGEGARQNKEDESYKMVKKDFVQKNFESAYTYFSAQSVLYQYILTIFDIPFLVLSVFL